MKKTHIVDWIFEWVSFGMMCIAAWYFLQEGEACLKYGIIMLLFAMITIRYELIRKIGGSE